MVSSLASLALLLAVAEGFRVKPRRRVRRSSSGPGHKLIAGVPVYNYEVPGKPFLSKKPAEEREWVVVAKEGTTTQQLETMCKATKQCKLAGDPSRGGVPFLEMRGTEADLAVLIQQSQGTVKYVEPDHEVSMIPEIQADPQTTAWGLNRIGAAQSGRTGAGTTVFIFDTGVRVGHTDFGGRAFAALDLSYGMPIECAGLEEQCGGDFNGHGTHCAGTAAGTTYGVAPSARIGGIKVLNDQGQAQWSWSIMALNWLAAGSIRPAVASMSLGGPGTSFSLADGVNVAVKAGVIVVVAAGNNNADACDFSPAFVPSAITVGCTTSSDSRCDFSNYGSCVDIWAPGFAILSSGVLSNSATDTMSGTSMSCPHVSGAAALILEASPTKTPEAVLQEMRDTAHLNIITDLQSDDANALLTVAEGGATPFPPTPPSPPTPQPTLAPPTPRPPYARWEITGSGCEDWGMCVASRNHPNHYGNDEECTITFHGNIPLVVGAFETEMDHDFITVLDHNYSGGFRIANGVYNGTISWKSDSAGTRRGWRFCRTD